MGKSRRLDVGKYRVLRGISWPKENGGWHNVEAHPTKVRGDLPPEHVDDWLSVGAIEPIEEEA